MMPLTASKGSLSLDVAIARDVLAVGHVAPSWPLEFGMSAVPEPLMAAAFRALRLLASTLNSRQLIRFAQTYLPRAE